MIRHRQADKFTQPKGFSMFRNRITQILIGGVVVFSLAPNANAADAPKKVVRAKVKAAAARPITKAPITKAPTKPKATPTANPPGSAFIPLAPPAQVPATTGPSVTATTVAPVTTIAPPTVIETVPTTPVIAVETAAPRVIVTEVVPANEEPSKTTTIVSQPQQAAAPPPTLTPAPTSTLPPAVSPTPSTTLPGIVEQEAVTEKESTESDATAPVALAPIAADARGVAEALAVGSYVKVNLWPYAANVRACASTTCGVYGALRSGTAVTMSCWTDNQWVIGNYNSNRWFKVSGGGLNGFIHSSFVINQTPTPNCNAGGGAASGSIGVRAADKASAYVGQWGGNACVSAFGGNGYVGGYSGGQCRQFVNCVVKLVSGINPAASDYSFPGARNLGKNVNAAVKGDIIQWGVGGHTAIILANLGGGNFSVVDSNWGYTEKVSIHNVNFYYRGDGTIYRY
jgi:hypothetical protein